MMFKKTIAFLFFFLLILELFARYVLGLGEIPLYIESDKYEYVYAPNQNVKRFGNRIITNEYSMRSLPLSSNDEIRILKFGDSVINGGSLTDHDDLASTILEKRLSEKFKKKIRVLNISAGSWGPDNAFAYLKENGNFGAKRIVLVFSSHDLYDNMGFGKVVGIHKSWPDKQPFLAITDGVENYFLPRVKNFFNLKDNFESSLQIQIDENVVNSGWEDFIEYSKASEIPLFVYLHATKKETEKGKLNKNGRKLVDLLKSKNVRFITGIEFPIFPEGYRDNIHINGIGQDKLSRTLYNQILQEKFIE